MAGTACACEQVKKRQHRRVLRDTSRRSDADMRCNRLPDIGLAYHAYFSVVCPAPTNFTSKIISYSCQKSIWRQYPVFQRAAKPCSLHGVIVQWGICCGVAFICVEQFDSALILKTKAFYCSHRQTHGGGRSDALRGRGEASPRFVQFT